MSFISEYSFYPGGSGPNIERADILLASPRLSLDVRLADMLYARNHALVASIHDAVAT